MSQFVIGNRYLGPVSKTIHTCIGIDLNGGPILQSEARGYMCFPSKNDLDQWVEYKELKTLTEYVNIYHYADKILQLSGYASRKEADARAKKDRIGCIKVTYTEGQFDE